MTLKTTIAEIEEALGVYGQDRVRLSTDGELIILDAPELRAPAHLPRTTRTFSTTNIVIDAVRGWVWAEDLAHDTFPGAVNEFLDRAAKFIDREHVHRFGGMDTFSGWLIGQDAVVDRCWILGAELSDEERAA